MKAALAIVLVAGCTPTFTDHFLDVRPVRAVPANGTACADICASKRPYDGIDSCVVATFDLNPRFVCRVQHHRQVVVDLDWLVDIPPAIDLKTLPRTGDVPLSMCEAAGCSKHFDSDNNHADTIVGCSVYPYRPDETQPYLVCSFHHDRKAETM